MKYLAGLGAVAVLVVATLLYVQGLKKDAYEAGYDKATVVCEERIGKLKAAVDEGNRVAMELREKQIVAYRKSLELRNEQYGEVNRQLKEKLARLEEIEDEMAKDWFNTPVPDVYR